MQIITNTALIESRVKWARRISMVGMGSLIIGFMVNLQSFSQPELSTLAMIFLLIGLVAAVISSNMVNDWLREPRADQFLAETLKRFGNDYVLYSYTLSTFNIIQTPTCLYVITVKNQTGEVRVEGNEFKQKFSWLRILRFFSPDSIGSPVTELLKSVEKVRQSLQPEMSQLPEIYPLIVFSNKEAKLIIKNPTIPVVHDRELRNYLKSNGPKQPLSADQQRVLAKILGGSYIKN